MPHSRLTVLLLCLALPVVLLAGVAIGSTTLSLEEWRQALGGGPDNPLRVILWEVRLPRVLLGALVGAALGLTGAAMQGFLKNPLADPGVLGVSSGAALGAVLMFYAGLAARSDWLLPAGGMLGALVAALLILVLAGSSAAPHTLVLAGMALNSLFGALTTLALSLSPNPFANLEIVFWLMGSLLDRGWNHVALATPFIAAGAALLFATGPALRALSLGEDTAASLGFRLGRTRLLLVTGAALAVGACVAVSGVIAFVGLVIPHLLRRAAGGDPQRLLLLSALGGAVLLPFADLLVRASRVAPELKLGVVTALVGAPFFLLLLARLRKELP